MMTIFTRQLSPVLAVLAFAAFTIAPANPAKAFSAVEKLYAELAKLPDAERQKEILEGARKEGLVVMLNTTSGKPGVTHINAFQKMFPQIKASRGELNPADAGERIVAETRAGRHISDSLTLGTPDMGQVLKMGIAARFPTPATARILPQYRGALDPENRWLPWQMAEQGMSYNPKMLADMNVDPPKTRMDLCDPKYRGQVSFDPLSDRVLAGLYAIMGEEKLKKFLECIGKNEPIIMQGQTPRIMLLLAGDHAIQGVNTLYLGTRENMSNPKKAPFKAVYTEPVMVYPLGAIINSQAPHPYAAALFTDWLLSDASQGVIAEKFRGTMIDKHPFFPPEAEVVVFGLIDEALQERLRSYWLKHVGDRR